MISIVTVNYNGEKVTGELLESLRRVDFGGEVIVVDNASVLNEAEILKAKFPEIIAIRADYNGGFAEGNNLGIKVAKGDIIFLLNNDTTVNQGFDSEIESFFESHPAAGAATPKICFEYAPTTIQFAGYTPLSSIALRNNLIGYCEIDTGKYDAECQTAYAHGAAMAVRRSVVEQVGLMPECYFLYYEELDWSLSITRAGWQIWYMPSTTIYHKESRTTGRSSPLKTYYQTRNRILFAKRNLSGSNRLLSICFQSMVSMPVNVLRDLVGRRTDLAKATIKGVIDGIKLKVHRKSQK